MNVEDLEAALARLEELLTEEAPEAEFQRLFEGSPVILELRTNEGEVLTVPGSVPSHDSSSPILVNIEVGTNQEAAFVQMRIEDSLAGQLRLPRRNLQPSLAFSKATLGNNVDYTAGGWFGMFEWAIYSQVPSFSDRLRLVRYFLRQRATSKNLVLFSGDQGMDMQGLSDEAPFLPDI